MGGKKDSLLVTVKFFDAERGNIFSLLAEAGDIVLLKEGENNSIIEKMISGYHLIQWLRCEDRLSIDGMITRMGYSSKIARQSLVTAARSVISSSG